MTKTRQALVVWGRGDAEGEYLAAEILQLEGFTEVDPVHPQGGPDGKKDLTCRKDGIQFVVACFFPNNSNRTLFKGVRKKFKDDLSGVKKNAAQGIVFVTNASVSEKERDKLTNLGKKAGAAVVLYHLERLRAVLDTPPAYGIRLSHLDVEMTKEEASGVRRRSQQDHGRD